MVDLKRTLLVLASESYIQTSLFPDFACKGDEMVNEFGEAWDSADRSTLNKKALFALEKLDKYLSDYSGESYREHYTDNEMLGTSEVWNNIRSLAKESLSALNWPYEVPKQFNVIYLVEDEI